MLLYRSTVAISELLHLQPVVRDQALHLGLHALDGYVFDLGSLFDFPSGAPSLFLGGPPDLESGDDEWGEKRDKALVERSIARLAENKMAKG